MSDKCAIFISSDLGKKKQHFAGVFANEEEGQGIPFKLLSLADDSQEWFISRNPALRVSIWPDQMMNFEWAKPVATKLLVLRMSRLSAAN